MSDANTMETTEEPTPAEFQPIEESTSQTTDMTLDWLCWERATSGERFYPPEETAVECVEALTGSDEDVEHAEFDPSLDKEVGQHQRAWLEAVEFFDSLQARGYDPVARVERHIAYSRIIRDLDLPRIDWEWLRESHYGGEVPDDDE